MGSVWDDAASTCYGALVSEGVDGAVVSSYSAEVLGACTRYASEGGAGRVTGSGSDVSGCFFDCFVLFCCFCWGSGYGWMSGRMGLGLDV